MITEQDLKQAIAECQGERNPNASTCIKLAAFFTIRNELFGKSEQLADPGQSYSFAAEPADTTIDYNSGTDFSMTIHGRDPDDIWPIMDELMSTLQIAVPRLYTETMNALQA